MTNDDHAIEMKLFAYIRDECLPKNERVELSEHDNLFERGVVDSAGLISFICFMEKEFNLRIPDEDLLPENFASVASIAAYLRSHQQAIHASKQEMRRVGSR